MPLLLLLSACDPAPAPADSEAPAPLEHLFSFAILADPHITTDPERQARLADAVAWINQNAAAERIELVWVLGDIGWGEGLAISYTLLGELTPLWLPVIGDNEIHFGDEQNFNTVFEPQLDAAAAVLPGWSRGVVEVYNPVHAQTSWLQNFSFTYGGLRWVGLDWCSRSDHSLLSELGELHDFEGGTLPYLAQDLGQLPAGLEEDVLLFSHHPMHLGIFDQAQLAAITALTGPLANRVAGAYAGHAHLDAEVLVEEGGYTAWVTDAVWDDVNTVRVVEVHSDGARVEYVQDLVILP